MRFNNPGGKLQNPFLGVIGCIAIFMLHSGSVFGQFAPNPTRQSSGNEPALVRPQGHSIASPANTNSFPKPINSQSEQPEPSANFRDYPPQISTLPTGQRVFTQNTEPAGVPLSNRSAPENQQPFRDASVQPASWTAEPAPSTQDLSKSRTAIELKAPSKDTPIISKPKSGWTSILSTTFSLTIVVCLFLIIAWLFRKSQPANFAKLPSEVVQVMGRTAMAPRQQVYVVRFGSKMLLVSHQPGQTQTLGEITDLDEVQRLAGLCEANQPSSISHSFRDVLKQVASGQKDREPRSRRSSRLHDA